MLKIFYTYCINKIFFKLNKAQTLLNGDECKYSHQCDSKKGLICIKNSCQCLSSSLYWNTNNQICGSTI